MLKFKMSLLFNNLKFRVAVVMFLITAITLGIVFIPKNKAAEISNDVNIKAPSTGITVGGRDVYAIQQDGNFSGYENVFCIDQEATIGKSGYKTYSNPIDITKSSSYFTNYNSAMWLINNMYLSTVSGNGYSNETAKQISIINLANILTTDTVKQSVKSKTGVDYSGVTPQKIYNLRNKVIGNGAKRNAIEIIEQIALWNYTHNKGTTISDAYNNNPKQYLTNANLSEDEQITLKYMYYALIDVANKKSNVPASTSTVNQITLKKDEAKYNADKKQVGPYYIQADGIKLTSYSFGETKNASYPINITITKTDGSSVKVGNQAVIKNNDGSFYINLSSYSDAKKVDFEITHVLLGFNTTAYVLDGGSDQYGEHQDILAVQKVMKPTSLKDSKEISVPGEYTIELVKVKEDGTTVITSTEAEFKVNGSAKSTTKGILTIEKGRKISNENQVDNYEIVETKAPEGYKAFEGTLKIKVGFKLENGKYIIDSTKTSKEGFVGKTNLVVSKDGTKITVYVPNEQKIFDLALRKFISEINGKEVTPSREPIINEQSIKMLEQTGTASYYHPKDSISVKVGDEIEYTIRVYNEGEILGLAKEITDYLPEGLSFVKLSDDNSKEYTTTSKTGDKKVVIQYTGNTVIQKLRDFIDKKVNVTSEYYQEVKMICKVENTDKLYITNRAEITNYGYLEKDENSNSSVWKEANKVGVDVDSVQNTIKDSLNLDSWYENAKENTYVDENGNTVVDKNYYPGSQDDDDFETVELLTGKYNVIIKKVDATDGKTPLQGAYFKVNGSNIKESEVGPTNKNGEVYLVKGVKISDNKQQDTYTIKETKAPERFKLYEGEIKATIATKFDGNNFVIDSQNTKVTGKDVKFTVNNEKTTITIIVPNIPKQFDLSLRKFITEVNGKQLSESREPKVDISKLLSGESTTAIYNHSKNPVDVNTSDIVTYTIRVYNEGEVAGYANKIMDDIPEGLEYVPATYDIDGKPTNLNAIYGWTLYKEVGADDVYIPEINKILYNGKTYIVTDNVKEADVIVTDYLSKDNGENNLIIAFDSKTMKELDYKDVKVSFKVIEPTTSDRIITNYAQITDDSDSNGNSVTDRDSTPNEWNNGEDDQDIEKIKVRYFDLSLLKWVSKAIVYEDGYKTVTETGYTGYENPEPIVKVDLKNTKLNNVEVKFEYTIRVTNEGQIEGYAKEISDYIPQGLRFVASDNPNWKEVDGKIVTRALENTLLKPGEYADVTVILTWINGENNLGLKTNIAEISEDYNDYGTPDNDSTPNNKVDGEDDIDNARVMLTIKTGKPAVYTGLAIAVLAIVVSGVIVIRKKVL